MNHKTKTANASTMTEIARRITDIQNRWSNDDRNSRAKEGAARRDQLLSMLRVKQASAMNAAA